MIQILLRDAGTEIPDRDYDIIRIAIYPNLNFAAGGLNLERVNQNIQ